jgi:hypothetical protein
LIDDTLDSRVENNLNNIRDFIDAQPASTVIGIGYMANAAVNVAQNFTADHELAVKALRLPRGSFSTMDSPYLSLISLVKGWQQQNVRREVPGRGFRESTNGGLGPSVSNSRMLALWHGKRGSSEKLPVGRQTYGVVFAKSIHANTAVA